MILSSQELENEVRAIGAERYHTRHLFHRLMVEGELNRGQMQAWALNRYCYQSAIPRKDAAIIARSDDSAFRREWRQRLVDHDGEDGQAGGLQKWVALAEGLGLDPAYVRSQKGALPATQFAVEAYVRFVSERSMLEAVASSLTELFSPTAIAERVSGILRNYDFIDKAALSYFDNRMTQAPRDSLFALDYVKDNARDAEQQQLVLDAVRFKCSVLWAQLDALYAAYVLPALPPPGAFIPAAQE